MLKRSLSERSHVSHVKAIGVRVLPSTFQKPKLRVTGISLSGDDDSSRLYPSRNPSAIENGSDSELRSSLDKTLHNGSYINSLQFKDLDLEELAESERDLKIDYDLGRTKFRDSGPSRKLHPTEEFVEDKKLLERLGLDEVLQVCLEYEQDSSRKNHTPLNATDKKASPRLCTISKIKTNGSLTCSIPSRKSTELLKQRNNLSNMPILELQLQHQSSDGKTSDSENSAVDQFSDCNLEDRFSSNSSGFVDVTSPGQTRSYYENENDDDVFLEFSTSSSHCVNNDDAMVVESGRRLCRPKSAPHSALANSNSVGRRPIANERCNDNIAQRIFDFEWCSKNERLKSELLKLKEMKTEAAKRMSKSKSRLREIEKKDQKLIEELERKMDIFVSDAAEEMASLRLEDDRMSVIKEQQVELLLEAAKEREEFQEQIEAERRKLEEFEDQHWKTWKHLKSSSSDPPEMQTETLLAMEKEREAVESQRRIFDDLEFSILELETRHEEEREPVQRKLATELDSLLKVKYEREEAICKLEQQKQDALNHAKLEIMRLEKDHELQLKTFKQERLVYVAAVEQMDRLLPLLRSGTGDDSTWSTSKQNYENVGEELCFSSSVSRLDEDLCRTPPRIRLRSLEMKKLQDYQSLPRQPKDGVKTEESLSSNSVFCENQANLADVENHCSPFSKVFGSGSDDSSFNSLEEILNSDTSRTEARSQTMDDTTLKTETFPVSQGGRSVGRSLSEPLSKKLDIAASVALNYAVTDLEIRYRDNRSTQARPLTRYLPIRDKTLDLRSFVESSGHSLDENSQVYVTPSTCSGYLRKQGGKLRLWHKRWFVFDRQKRCLKYYVDRTEARLRRTVYFQAILDIFVDHLGTVISPNHRLTFCLKTLDRKYYLVAPTAEAMRIWIDVLFTGAEGYQEYL